MKTFYLLLLALAISATSCRTKEGEPGPAGESALNKQGTISGTITYTNDQGNEATAAFNYEYFETLKDNAFTNYESGQESYYGIDVIRRSIQDEYNYAEFNLDGTGMNGIEDAPSSIDFEFSYVSTINNEIIGFFADGDEVVITNFNLDASTGRVTFDYSTIVYDINNNEVTLQGKVDVTLPRLRIAS